MFKNLTYKQKNKLLIVAFVFVLFLLYTISIKRTVNNYFIHSDNLKQLEEATLAPTLVSQLKEELATINSKLGTQRKGEGNNSDRLIELVTNYCNENNAVLMEFPQMESAIKDDLVVETNKFTLSGNFQNLLKLVYLLEQEYKLGKVASVNYKMVKNYKARENILTATVYVQNIKKKENEN